MGPTFPGWRTELNFCSRYKARDQRDKTSACGGPASSSTEGWHGVKRAGGPPIPEISLHRWCLLWTLQSSRNLVTYCYCLSSPPCITRFPPSSPTFLLSLGEFSQPLPGWQIRPMWVRLSLPFSHLGLWSLGGPGSMPNPLLLIAIQL